MVPSIRQVCVVTVYYCSSTFIYIFTILSYSVEQVYNVVYEIGKYKEFLPWCIDSVVTKETGNTLHAKLVVGFPPLKESYTSIVTVKPNKSIHVSNE